MSAFSLPGRRRDHRRYNQRDAGQPDVALEQPLEVPAAVPSSPAFDGATSSQSCDLDPAAGCASIARVDERLVARLWDDQHPFALPLKTASGEEVRVVYRGRRRYDRGPDFPGALIALRGESLVLGDVEVHVNSSDWRRHGHHRDPHYNGVVLHVVLYQDDPTFCLRQDGIRVPEVVLSSHLSMPLEKLLTHDVYDSPRPSPCWQGSLESGSELSTMLEECGMERHEARVRRYEAGLTCCSQDQLLYQGIATALGYSQNRVPFEKLADLLPLDVVLTCRRTTIDGRGSRSERGGGIGRQTAQAGPGEPLLDNTPVPRDFWHLLPLEALMMGVAGLLPSQRGVPREPDPYSEAAEEWWRAEGASWAGSSMKSEEWQFFRVRPNNFPTRRLAALAQVVSRWPVDGLAAALESLTLAFEPRKLPRALEALLLDVPRDGYWAGHCDFGLDLRRPMDLVGRQRAAEIAINVFLPFLTAYALVNSNEELGLRAREVYRLYPKRGDNELARYVASQVTGVPRPRAARSACRQQGLLHVYRMWCEVKRCADCPCGDAAMAATDSEYGLSVPPAQKRAP